MKWRAALFLAVAWLLLSPGCLNSPAPETRVAPEAYIEYARLEELLGFAHWVCSEPHPTAWVRIHFRGTNLAYFDAVDLWATPGFKETVAHELKHLEQAHAAGGCEAWQEQVKDPAFRDRAEAEATCAGMIVGRGIACEVSDDQP